VFRRAIFLVSWLFAFSQQSAFAGDPFAGKKIWGKHTCPMCHGIDGVPVIPGTPNFARGEGMIKPDSQLLLVVYSGAKLMPAWKGLLTRQEMINVVTYIRTLQK